MSKSVSIHLGKVPAAHKQETSVNIRVIGDHIVIKSDYTARELGMTKDLMRAALLEIVALERQYEMVAKRKARA